ncbi:MAG: ribosome biogenesis/translation initiation ATPase RLI [Candidatus Aenigmatarchaeota archaeon]|nr:MAG: ribosome biogenesis/translation initiation ATPase RLI [Candidatus Aenigmarchaeota archaeon]
MRKRLAVIDREVCKPTICNHLCKRVCPVNRSGEDCITISSEDNKPNIDESLCIGCGICVSRCPTNAIAVINLPAELKENPVYRYGMNQFELYRLPVPKNRMVVGMIGQNGVGKSTAIKILSKKLKPNLGILDKDIPLSEVMEMFRGSELQNYFTRLEKGDVKVAYKPQNVDDIPKMWSGRVSDLFKKMNRGEGLQELRKILRLEGMLDKDVKTLSGGELQLLAVTATMLKDADLYFFDEPSSYLDVEQRLRVAAAIRRLSKHHMVMVVEHDLAVADYLADQVHMLYGKPAVFGIISKPDGVRVGINTYLEGFIREENMRFRDESIIFSKSAATTMKTRHFMDFPHFTKKFERFSLQTEAGNIYKGEVVGILGPNATGKSTFINILTGNVKPDSGEPPGDLRLAYKPQKIELEDDDKELTVRLYLSKEMKDKSMKQRIIHMLDLERLMEKKLDSLSGGEVQSVMIAATLGKPFDILLLDEPTAFLDVEQRLRASKLIREVVENKEAAAFVVDHDLQILDSISDRLMLFEGERGVHGHAWAPSEAKECMNAFLKKIGITFRRDPQTGRARANKPGSQKDSEQKGKDRYFYVE